MQVKTTLFNDDAIGSNYAFYHAWKTSLLRQIKAGTASQTCLELIGRLATFSWFNFNGLLADFELEQSLCAIGQQAGVQFRECRQDHTINRVLHVASELYGTGGHTRVLMNWLSSDKARTQAVLLLRRTKKLPDIVESRSRNAAVLVDMLHQSSIAGRVAEATRYINAFKPDLVILHTHPDEVLTPILFGRQRGFRVIAYNHADHVFWLGASVVDAVVDFRECGRRFTRRFRGIDEGFVLPYPMESLPDISRETARKSLQICDQRTVLLTMASEHKLIPFRDANFFEFADELLDRVPQAQLYVIGIPNSRNSLLRGRRNSDRINLLGVIENPLLWCAAADFFLEPTPLCTGLAAFDVLRHGARLIQGWREYSIYGEGVAGILPPELSGTVLGKHSQRDSLSQFADSIVQDMSRESNRQSYTSFWDSLTCNNYSKKLDALYTDLSDIPPRLMPRTIQPESLHSAEASSYADYCNSIWPPTDCLEQTIFYLLREACRLDSGIYRHIRLLDRGFRWLGRKISGS